MNFPNFIHIFPLKDMNIGITCYPTYGGSGVIATELGKVLAMRGHKIHFISYALPFRLDSFIGNVYYHEVEISNYPLFDFPLYTPALASKIVEVARLEKLDILHAHYAIPHAISAFIAKQILGKENLKIITTLHGTDITLVGLEPSFLPLMKFSIEQSDGVTAVSEFLKNETLSNYNIKKDIKVIPNFVDTEKYRPIDSYSIKNEIAPSGEKILIHVSNFRHVKRVQDVIRIFHLILKEIPAKLILIGDGPDRTNCESLARDLGISEHVKFLGKQFELVPLLSAADIFLIPSEVESFGLSALEAMACGLPVVGSNVGGLSELILHNKTGYIAPVGNIQQMAEYTLKLLTDKILYSNFSSSARERAVKHYDYKLIIKQYEQYYNQVLLNG